MNTKNYLLVLSLLALLSSACVSANQNSNAQFENKTWVLTNYNNSQPIEGYQPTIELKDGQVSGNSGCNHYGGSYQINGEAIAFEGIFSTEMACLDTAGIMDQEQIYLALLTTVERYELNNDELQFFSGSNVILTFAIQHDVSVAAEPTPEPTEVSPTATIKPTPLPTIVPLDGFQLYEDEVVGVSVYLPDSWVVSQVVEGQYAIFQSYPLDKYIGGEPFADDDTKCDLNILPIGTQAKDLIEQWEADSFTTIVSQEQKVLQSGLTGQQFVLESMGRSVALVTEINDRAVSLVCFGNADSFEKIGMTLSEIK